MSERESIHVLCVDDHEIMRGGIYYLLMTVEDIELVGEAQSGEEALGLCDTLHPDVILMDMRMSGLDGIQTTKLVRERYPETQVLALTSYEDEEMIRQVMQAGAIGYLQKGIAIDELAEAIRMAHAGKPTLSAEAFKVLVQGSVTQPDQSEFDLTERELQVLEMIIQGASNAEISDHLVITEATVKYHISNILKKLGVSNRTEAAALAVRHNLVTKS